MNPLPKDRRAASVEKWIHHARSDLNMGKLAQGCEVLPEHVCFHAQQAAEKAIKAVLLHYGIDFPMTHDIQELVDMLGREGRPIASGLEDVGALTPFAVEARYPGYWGEITTSDVVDAVALAERVVDWAQDVIRSAVG